MKMPTPRNFLFLTTLLPAFFLFFQAVPAQFVEIPTLELSPNLGRIDLSPYVRYSSNGFTIEDFLVYADAMGFQPLDSLLDSTGRSLAGVLFFGNPTDRWLRKVLVFGDHDLQVETVQFRQYYPPEVKRNGMFLRRTERDNPDDNWTSITLELEPGEYGSLFFRLEKQMPGTWHGLAPELWPHKEWQDQLLQRHAIQGMFMGSLLFLFAFSSLIALLNRKSACLFLGLTALFLYFHFMITENFWNNGALSDYPFGRKVVFLAIIPALGVFLPLFLKNLLRLKSTAPGWGKIFVGLAVLSSALFTALALLFPLAPSEIFKVTGGYVGFVLLFTLASLITLALPLKMDVFFFLIAAILSMILGAGFHFAYHLNGWFDNATPNLMQAGMALGTMGLGAALLHESRIANSGYRAFPVDQQLILLVNSKVNPTDDSIRALLAAEHQVVQLPEGSDALEFSAKQIPDLIVCDAVLEDMDPEDLLRALRADPRTCHIPFLLLANDRIDAPYSADADYCQICPPAPEAVHQCLKSLLSSRENRYRLFRMSHAFIPDDINLYPSDKAFLLDLQTLLTQREKGQMPPMENLAEQIGMTPHQFSRKVNGLTGKKEGNRWNL